MRTLKRLIIYEITGSVGNVKVLEGSVLGEGHHSMGYIEILKVSSELFERSPRVDVVSYRKHNKISIPGNRKVNQTKITFCADLRRYLGFSEKTQNGGKIEIIIIIQVKD